MSDTPNETPDEQANETPSPPAITPPADQSNAELEALKAQLAETAKQVLASVPENLRDLIPANLSPADQIAWFNKAKATGVFEKPAVPATPTKTPAITPQTPDTASLPIYARLAAGYSKSA
jgi:hypothetical protein